MYANIIVDISHEKLDKTFQYLVPPELEGEITEGMRVAVPFGSRKIAGYVTALTDTPEYDVSKIRPVLSIIKESVAIESQLIALAAWMRQNYGGTMNQALKTVLPVKRQENHKLKKQVRLLVPLEEAKSIYAESRKKHYTAQEKLLAELMECPSQPYLHLTKDLNIASSVIQNFVKKGIVGIRQDTYYRNPVAQDRKSVV